MSNGKPQITKIEAIGIIISSLAALATIALGFVTYRQGRNIENLQSKFEREKLFSENLSGAINYLSSGDRTSRRMAVVSLTNSAETEEQIKEVVKIIIIATNSEEKKEDNSYQLLLQIASLNSEKEAKINKALEDEDIGKLLKLFPPFPVTSQLAQIPPEPKSEGEVVNLETKTQQLIDEQVNQVKNLVSKIYSTAKSQRQSAVSELSKDNYRPYDEIMVREMLKRFKQDSDNYFGIVNTLFLLGKVDISYLKSNRDTINQLVDSADRILNAPNKTQYLVPIKNRLNSL